MEEEGGVCCMCIFSRSPNELCAFMLMSAAAPYGGEVAGHAPRVTSAGPSSPPDDKIYTRLITTHEMNAQIYIQRVQDWPAAAILQCISPENLSLKAFFDANRSINKFITFTLSHRCS